MRPIVSDTGPLNYLVLIDAVDCLSKQFGRVLIPETVAVELSHPATPLVVRAWLDTAPAWLERWPDLFRVSPNTSPRGAGERTAIELARAIDARLLLIDDRAGDTAARAHSLKTTGTLGVLVRAAQLGMVDLNEAFARLRETNFRCRPELLDALLIKHALRDRH